MCSNALFDSLKYTRNSFALILLVFGIGSALYVNFYVKPTIVGTAYHYGLWSLLPAFITILLSWLTREPLTALLSGIAIGAFMTATDAAHCQTTDIVTATRFGQAFCQRLDRLALPQAIARNDNQLAGARRIRSELFQSHCLTVLSLRRSTGLRPMSRMRIFCRSACQDDRGSVSPYLCGASC